jgi:peroxin-19
MDLMQEAQEFGQPPADIIKEIAPGLELDENGLPKLNGSGMPFPGNGQECRIQ